VLPTTSPKDSQNKQLKLQEKIVLLHMENTLHSARKIPRYKQSESEKENEKCSPEELSNIEESRA
jgi:hypothetical protein